MSWWDFSKKLCESKFGKTLVGLGVILILAIFLEALLLSGTLIFNGKISMDDALSIQVTQPGTQYLIELRRRQDPNIRSLKYVINDPAGKIIAQDIERVPSKNDLYISFLAKKAGNYIVSVEPNDKVKAPLPIQVIENDRRVIAPFLNKYHIRIFQPKREL